MKTARCCPRLSPWWWTKVAVALGLAVQAFVVVGFGRGHPTVAIPPVVGPAVMVAGALLGATHYWILKQATPNLADPSTLVTARGLYPWIRHPMYLGDFLVIVGFALLCPTILSACAVPVAAIALVQLARFEDDLLAARFGDSFRAWAGRSTRLVPFVL